MVSNEINETLYVNNINDKLTIDGKLCYIL